MESTKIVWHDPQIFNSENSNYIKEYLSPLQYKAFTTVTETVQFLSSTKDKWVLVTSGTNGQELVMQIHDFPSVAGIIIFCRNEGYHKQWSSAFNKVKKVEIRHFKNVVEQARKIWNRLITSSIIEHTQGENKEYQQINNIIEERSLRIPSNPQACDISAQMTYYHMESELELKFLQMCKLTLKNEVIPRQAVLNELRTFGVTDKNKSDIEAKFNEYPNDLLRSFVYTYTTNLVFRRLNECYAFNDYSRTLNITAACILELKSRPELMLQNPTVLWRGAAIDDEFVNNFSIGDKGFWPAFTSTTMIREVAEFFSGNVLFEIHLQASEPHPHIIAESWSLIAQESEVLLLPYFPLVITNIQKIGNTTLIVVEQDSTHPSLAINSRTLINYWRSRIERDLIIPVDKVCDTIRNKVTNSFNLMDYFSQDLSSEHSVWQFAIDFEKIIRINYKKYEQEIKKLNSSARGSLLDYVKMMRGDMVNSIIFYIKEKVKNVFEIEFERIKSYFIKIMSYEAITTFNIPDDLLRDLISKIINLAAKSHFSSISSVKKSSHEESKGDAEPSIYLNTFIREMIGAIGSGISGYKEDIQVKNAEIKCELIRQLEELKIKIHQSLENVLL